MFMWAERTFNTSRIVWPRSREEAKILLISYIETNSKLSCLSSGFIRFLAVKIVSGEEKVGELQFGGKALCLPSRMHGNPNANDGY
jgi:hypothetical protein